MLRSRPSPSSLCLCLFCAFLGLSPISCASLGLPKPPSVPFSISVFFLSLLLSLCLPFSAPVSLFVFLLFPLSFGFPQMKGLLMERLKLQRHPFRLAPSCDLPARAPLLSPAPQPAPLSQRPPRSSPPGNALPVTTPLLADLCFPGGLPFGQLGERSWLLEEARGLREHLTGCSPHEGLGPLGTPGRSAWEMESVSSLLLHSFSMFPFTFAVHALHGKAPHAKHREALRSRLAEDTTVSTRYAGRSVSKRVHPAFLA